MTLDAALEKVDRQMDEIADRILIDAEDFIRDLGATDVECAVWLDRKRSELADTRRQMHDMVRASYWTSLDSPSVRVH